MTAKCHPEQSEVSSYAMKKNIIPCTIKYILVIALFMAISSNALYSKPKIKIAGAWNLVITEQDLQNGAGSDLNNTYESPATQTIVDIDLAGIGADSWRVYVKKSPLDANWHSIFNLFIRRSGNGQGPPPGSISGGTSYIKITEDDAFFYEGVKQRKNIPHQFKLSGVSAIIPAGTYATTIIYTIIDE